MCTLTSGAHLRGSQQHQQHRDKLTPGNNRDHVDDQLYVSFHSQPNLYSYNTLDGKLQSSTVLNTADAGKISNLRGFAAVDGELLVVNAYKKDSRIMKFSNEREFVENFASAANGPTNGLVHPYGIAVDDQYVFVSVQDTETVLRYNRTTGQLSDFGQQAVAPFGVPSPFKGALMNFNYTGGNGNGVRGLALAKISGVSVLFVAFQGHAALNYTSAVYAINAKSGQVLGTVAGGEDATTVAWDVASSKLFVGTKSHHKPVVQQYDIQLDVSSSDTSQLEAQLMGTYHHKSLSHCAGIAVRGGDLWVANQAKGNGTQNALLHFDISTGRVVGHINVQGKPEHIALV